MADQPLFSDLLVSTPRPVRGPGRRAAGIAAAAAAHLALLAAIVLIPFLVLEVMPPPKAVPREIIFRPFRPAGAGDRLPAAAIRMGTEGSGRRATREARALRPRPEDAVQPVQVPVAPPEATLNQSAETATTEPSGPADPGGGLLDDPGDPLGFGEEEVGGTAGCPGCVGKGPGGGIGEPLGGPGILAVGDPGVTQPVLIPSTRFLPAYPDVARRARVQGTVVLMIVILADGRVGEIEVVRSPDPIWGFDLAAIQSVRHWRYTPALMHGRPVAVHAQVVVEFTISR